VLTLLLAYEGKSQDTPVSIQTSKGTIVIGTRESIPRDRSSLGLTYYAFKGIQYARAERWQVRLRSRLPVEPQVKVGLLHLLNSNQKWLKQLEELSKLPASNLHVLNGA